MRVDASRVTLTEGPGLGFGAPGLGLVGVPPPEHPPIRRVATRAMMPKRFITPPFRGF